jgi:hypothetical protein
VQLLVMEPLMLEYRGTEADTITLVSARIGTRPGTALTPNHAPSSYNYYAQHFIVHCCYYNHDLGCCWATSRVTAPNNTFASFCVVS